MEALRRKISFPCLICGVDSGPIRTFLIVFIGGLVAASLLVLLWAWLTKRLRVDSTLGGLPLEAEKREREVQ